MSYNGPYTFASTHLFTFAPGEPVEFPEDPIVVDGQMVLGSYVEITTLEDTDRHFIFGWLIPHETQV